MGMLSTRLCLAWREAEPLQVYCEAEPRDEMDREKIGRSSGLFKSK
jgi:hypothetical protein